MGWRRRDVVSGAHSARYIPSPQDFNVFTKENQDLTESQIGAARDLVVDVEVMGATQVALSAAVDDYFQDSTVGRVFCSDDYSSPFIYSRMGVSPLRPWTRITQQVSGSADFPTRAQKSKMARTIISLRIIQVDPMVSLDPIYIIENGKSEAWAESRTRWKMTTSPIAWGMRFPKISPFGRPEVDSDDEEDFADWTVTELKDLLRKLGLRVSGRSGPGGEALWFYEEDLMDLLEDLDRDYVEFDTGAFCH